MITIKIHPIGILFSSSHLHLQTVRKIGKIKTIKTVRTVLRRIKKLRTVRAVLRRTMLVFLIIFIVTFSEAGTISSKGWDIDIFVFFTHIIKTHERPFSPMPSLKTHYKFHMRRKKAF